MGRHPLCLEIKQDLVFAIIPCFRNKLLLRNPNIPDFRRPSRVSTELNGIAVIFFYLSNVVALSFLPINRRARLEARPNYHRGVPSKRVP